MRPAAPEWDEREETPWPIIQEAAKVGLYGFDFLASSSPTRPGCRCRSSTRSSSGATPASAWRSWAPSLAVAAIFGQGTPEQIVEWIPQCFGTPTSRRSPRSAPREPDAGSDVGADAHPRRYDEATDEWVLNGQKAWATNGGIADVHVVIASVDRELGLRGQAAFVVPPGTPGPRAGRRSSRSTACAPRTPPTSSSTTAASPAAACSAARRSSTSASPVRARAQRGAGRPRCRRSR